MKKNAFRIRFLLLFAALFPAVCVLSACASLDPDSPPGRISVPGADVVYIYGWVNPYFGNSEKMLRNRRAEEYALLREVFPGKKIAMLDWQSQGSWGDCMKRADELTAFLQKKLEAMPAERRENIVLVGHSLGARVIVRALAAVADKKLRVGRVILLAAAVADDDPDIGRALGVSILPVINIYCAEDGVLRSVFGFFEGFGALGAYGNVEDYPHDRFLQFRVKGEYDHDNWLNNHWSVFYLGLLRDAMQNPDQVRPVWNPAAQPAPGVRPEYISESPVAPLWNTVETAPGEWRLQQHKIFRWQYHILDRRDMLRAEGSETDMRNAFDQFKKINQAAPAE